MTDDQKKYYAAMKKMGNKKPVKATPRPRVIAYNQALLASLSTFADDYLLTVAAKATHSALKSAKKMQKEVVLFASHCVQK